MANTEIPSSGIFKPRRNAAMASTLAGAVTATLAVPGYDIDSDSGKYIDLDGIDASKLVLLYSAISTGLAAFVVRTNNSPFSGKDVGTWQSTADQAIGTKDTEPGLRGYRLVTNGTKSTAGGFLMAGPFETAAVKDTDGYMHLDGTTAQSSVAVVHVTPILLP